MTIRPFCRHLIYFPEVWFLLQSLNLYPINMEALEQDIIWTKKLLDDRIVDREAEELIAPKISLSDHSVYATVVRENKLFPEERVVLALALIPYFMPHLLDMLYDVNPNTGRTYTYVGGRTYLNGLKSFIPTGETAIYLSGGTDL